LDANRFDAKRFDASRFIDVTDEVVLLSFDGPSTVHAINNVVAAAR
jgi:hypothetical protein